MHETELALLEEMLRIYSPSREEIGLSTFLVERMTSLGFQAYCDPVHNAIGVMGSGSRTIFLLGHIDTVPGNIPVQRKGSRLYGRGAVDAKGPMACFISAAHRLKGEVSSLDKRIVVFGAVEEEAATSRGARQLAKDFAPPHFCIIGEPSRWNAITLAYKGRLLVKYQLQVPLKHTAARGKLVCEQAVDFWNEIKSWCKHYNRGKSAFEGIDASIRSFHSEDDGFHESAHLGLGFRLPLRFPVERFKTFLLEAAGDGRCHFYGEELAVRSDKSNALVKTFLHSIRACHGIPKFKVKSGTSDMNVVAPVWNCPIVAYGPGDSALDHTPEEHIEIEEYGRAIDVLEFVLRDI
jgi:LysW-gamma-L-lysine carboxypeptidase